MARMSKHSRKKARNRRKLRRRDTHILCPECRTKVAADDEILLDRLADVLNACSDAGLRVRIWHGILRTYKGYVLQLPLDGKWVTRTLSFTEFSPGGDDPDYEDDDN